jgi:spermidine synthase
MGNSRVSQDSPRTFRGLMGLFFFSGFSSLIIEAVFCRLLTYTFGNTAQAVSTVLAAFLGGLALGAFALGRWVDRRRSSLRIYGALELFVAIYAVFIPKIFGVLPPVYVALYQRFDFSPTELIGVRFFLAWLVVLPPSFLMGGTLPVIGRFVSARRSTFIFDIDRLYAYNTLGAAAGTLICTYVFLPVLGLKGAIGVACAVNILIFATVMAMTTGERAAEAASEEARADAMTPEGNSFSAWHAFLLAAAFLTGASAVAYEVLWTHIQAYTVGNSVYAFGVMLFVMLLGLGFGAYFVARRVRGPADWGRALAASQALLGITVLLTLPLWGRLNYVFERASDLRLVVMISACALAVFLFAAVFLWWRRVRLNRRARLAARIAPAIPFLCIFPFYWYRANILSVSAVLAKSDTSRFVYTETFRFLCSFTLLIIPALLVGVSFPLLLNLFSQAGRGIGARVGKLYAANTVGAIVGALLAGFVLIPRYGSQTTLRQAGVFNILLALLFLVFVAEMGRTQKLVFAGVTVAAGIFCCLGIGNWNSLEMARGSYVYFYPQAPPDRVLYLREDTAGGLTSVVQRGDDRRMLSNWKFQGNNTSEVGSQSRFALIPILFSRKMDRALVIGLGTGNTLRTLSLFPFRQIDVAELAPHIVDAARTWFSDVNGGVLDNDPRVHVSVTDGRNFLLVSRTQYDLITVEISSIWMSGEADLYNREFYELCRARLGSSGVLQQWVQIHHMPTATLLVLLNTAAHVFPHLAFFVGPDQGLLIASSAPLEGDYAQWERLEADSGVAQQLSRLGVPSLASFLGDVMIYGDSMNEALGELPRLTGRKADFVSTDFFPFLEYATPKGNTMAINSTQANLDFLRSYRPSPFPPEMKIQNLPSPGTMNLIYGYVLEEHGQLAEAVEYFTQVRGPGEPRAQAELARIKLRLEESSKILAAR